MILYLDSSAIVKRYIAEYGSELVNGWINEAEVAAIGIIARVEVSAAIAKARRMKLVLPEAAEKALDLFHAEWPTFYRLPVNEAILSLADDLAFAQDLRGYDATHLACAVVWQDAMNEGITLATFDAQLRQAAIKLQLAVLP